MTDDWEEHAYFVDGCMVTPMPESDERDDARAERDKLSEYLIRISEILADRHEDWCPGKIHANCCGLDCECGYGEIRDALIASKHPMSTPLETQRITAECRTNRGINAAWSDAIRLLWQVYDIQVHRHPGATISVAIYVTAPPEGHAEPEPAWGENRPVHGHTEQTGDGHG